MKSNFFAIFCNELGKFILFFFQSTNTNSINRTKQKGGRQVPTKHEQAPIV
jgi:hypothetical protein